MTDESSQLVLVKQFAEESERMLERATTFGDGQAVSLMQDAIELLIRAVVRNRNIEVPTRATLDQMADAISKTSADESNRVPHRTRIEDLNKARVSFKHSGTSPSNADARRLVRYGLEFLEVAVPRFFGIEFRRISLVHSIRSPEIAELLVRAEAAMEDERFNDAMVEASDAVGVVERTIAKVMPLPTSPIRLSGVDGRALDELLKYLNGLRNVSVAAMMQFDLRDLMRFRMTAPRVLGSGPARRQAIFNGPVQHTEEQADAAISFATSFALAVQSRID